MQVGTVFVRVRTPMPHSMSLHAEEVPMIVFERGTMQVGTVFVRVRTPMPHSMSLHAEQDQMIVFERETLNFSCKDIEWGKGATKIKTLNGARGRQNFHENYVDNVKSRNSYALILNAGKYDLDSFFCW